MMPEFGVASQNLFRCAYGILLLLFLLTTLPQARRFFLTERWRGYAESRPALDAVLNPFAMPLLLALWSTSAVLLVAGRWSVVAALVNLFICRFFFLSLRWRTLSRGLGAPGFMIHWLALAVFLLELTHFYGSKELRSLTLLALQVDFAFLYLSSGWYKLTAGYARGDGMDLGMVNPMWGRWFKALRRLKPSSVLFRLSNQAAWSLELLAGVLMLIPATRVWGGLLLVVSFVYIAGFVRLGVLCPMVALVGVLYVEAGSFADLAISRIFGGLFALAPTAGQTLPTKLEAALMAALWGYIALLPLVYTGLFVNFYGRRRLPDSVQRLLEWYSNFFGVIIWRVFSADLVAFFVRIYDLPTKAADVQLSQAGTEREITQFGHGLGRYGHVGESITLTCVFTTLKYYPSRPELFQERLLRYVRSLPLDEGHRALFRYFIIDRSNQIFTDQLVAEFLVDPALGTVEERTIDDSHAIRSPLPVSPIHEAARPGSYAPSGS